MPTMNILADMVRRRSISFAPINPAAPVIIDEWLLYPLKETEARDILEIMESRYKESVHAFDHNSVGVESSIQGPAADSFVDMNAQTLVAYCTFDHVMTYEEFVKWVSDNGIDSCWGAICVKTTPNTYAFDYETIDLVGANLGMRLNSSCSHLTFDQEKYPELTLFSLSETTGEEQNWIPSEENAKRHVASMLRYAEDHPAFFEQMGIFVENHRYEKMAKRVEEQGLFFYGCCFTGTPNEILRTAESEDGHVIWLYTEPVQ